MVFRKVSNEQFAAFYHTTINAIQLIMSYKKNIQDCLPFERADFTGSTAL